MQNVLKCDNIIIYANIIAVMEDLVVSRRINYVCIALSLNKFVLPNLSIAVNL